MIPIGQPSQPCKAMLPTSWFHTLNHTSNNLIYPISCAFGRLTVGLFTNHWSSIVGCNNIIHGFEFITFLQTALASSSHVMLEFNGFSSLLSGGLPLKIL